MRWPGCWRLPAALALAGIAAAGCGKKGPPLAPIVRIPAAVEQIDARRVGNDVYVTLTIPGSNIDASVPADVSRIEIYAYSGAAAPPRPRFLEVATHVGTIDVRPVPPKPSRDGGPAPGAVDETDDRPAQGTPVVVRESLSPEALVARPIPPLPVRGREPAPVAARAPAPPSGPLRRFYTALAFSARGRPGPPGAVEELPLTLLPDPPLDVRLDLTADTLTLSWEPSGGLIGFLFDSALPLEPPPFDDPAPVAPASAAKTSAPAAAAATTPAPVALGDLPPGPTRYNVYRDIAPDPLLLPVRASPSSAARTERPVPVNAAPLDALAFVEDAQFDQRQRCYTVAALRGAEPNVVEGAPSARVCTPAIDVFAPAAPSGLSTIPAEGSISLIWEPNIELDLAGYLVLRGEPGSATLAPLTEIAIKETRFTDRQVTPGMRYVYAVVAVDDRLPLPNVSDESERVEETAR